MIPTTKTPSKDSLSSLSTFQDVPVSLFTLHKWQGRMSLGEFWIYTIAVTGCQFLLSMIAFLFDGVVIGSRQPVLGLILAMVIGAAAAWAATCIQIRRFHDHNMSGRWVLMNLVPLIGPIYVGVKLGLMDGDQGPNKYGNDPRVVAARAKQKPAEA